MPAAIDRKVYFAGLRRADAWAAQEARLVATAVRLAQLVLFQRADAAQQVELVTQMRAHHLGPVRRDRELHAVREERPERLAYRFLVRQCTREQIRRRADIQHELSVT